MYSPQKRILYEQYSKNRRILIEKTGECSGMEKAHTR